MSEHVLAALVECPLAPGSPSGPPTASSGFLPVHPHSRRAEAKASACECDSSRPESHLLVHPVRPSPHYITLWSSIWELSDSLPKTHLHGHSTGPPAPCLPPGGPQPPDLIGCFGKHQLLAPKGLI